MTIISDDDQKAIREMFSSMPRKVKVVFFTQSNSQGNLVVPCTYCKETQELLEEITSLSDKLELKTLEFESDKEVAKKYGVDKIPAIVLLGENDEDYGIKFYGIPSGYEFGTLIEDITMISQGDSGLSTGAKEKLKTLTKNAHIQVFVTPT